MVNIIITTSHYIAWTLSGKVRLLLTDASTYQVTTSVLLNYGKAGCDSEEGEKHCKYLDGRLPLATKKGSVIPGQHLD